MKVTKEYCDVYLDTPNKGECNVYMIYYHNDNVRVIEVPKVWRHDGKQYKIKEFIGPSLSEDSHYVIRAPMGCRVFYCGGKCEIEHYD